MATPYETRPLLDSYQYIVVIAASSIVVTLAICTSLAYICMRKRHPIRYQDRTLFVIQSIPPLAIGAAPLLYKVVIVPSKGTLELVRRCGALALFTCAVSWLLLLIMLTNFRYYFRMKRAVLASTAAKDRQQVYEASGIYRWLTTTPARARLFGSNKIVQCVIGVYGAFSFCVNFYPWAVIPTKIGYDGGICLISSPANPINVLCCYVFIVVTIILMANNSSVTDSFAYKANTYSISFVSVIGCGIWILCTVLDNFVRVDVPSIRNPGVSERLSLGILSALVIAIVGLSTFVLRVTGTSSPKIDEDQLDVEQAFQRHPVQQMLESKVARDAFKEYCITEFVAENAEFLDNGVPLVGKLNTMVATGVADAGTGVLLDDVLVTFVNDSAPYQINISSTLRTALVSEARAVTALLSEPSVTHSDDDADADSRAANDAALDDDKSVGEAAAAVVQSLNIAIDEVQRMLYPTYTRFRSTPAFVQIADNFQKELAETTLMKDANRMTTTQGSQSILSSRKITKRDESQQNNVLKSLNGAGASRRGSRTSSPGATAGSTRSGSDIELFPVNSGPGPAVSAPESEE